MIKHKNSGRAVEISCNEKKCSTSVLLSDVGGSFSEARKEAKKAGWMLTIENRKWHNICPECFALRVESHQVPRCY